MAAALPTPLDCGCECRCDDQAIVVTVTGGGGPTVALTDPPDPMDASVTMWINQTTGNVWFRDTITGSPVPLISSFS